VNAAVSSLMPEWKCTHGMRRIRRDENRDRIRIVETCPACGVYRHYGFAKRLADVADSLGNFEAWGPVGVWTTSEHPLAGGGS